MIYLDTHVVVWLYAGDQDKLTEATRSLLGKSDLLISPIVKLELKYLSDIKRITAKPTELLNDLAQRVGLRVCSQPFDEVIDFAMDESWTRDPFDRIITAHARLANRQLVSKDRIILSNYDGAIS